MVKGRVREIEMRILSELIRNSKRSDRELAKITGVSQPTVTRIVTKLEREGYIKQYTLIPDFSKLGYKIIAMTFVKLKRTISPEEREKAKDLAQEITKKGPYQIVMGERGMGMGYDGVFVSYHKNFSEYSQLKEWFRQFEFLEVDKIENFLIDLEDPVHYHPLDFTLLARDLTKKG